MNGKRFLGTALVTVVLLVLAAGLAMAQRPDGTPLTAAFTYQGRLRSSSVPYTGSCDLQFGLWDALSGGTQVGATQTVTDVGLADGYFTVQLDWGADRFLGDARWLEIYVRCPAGSGTYTPLTPRQPLTVSPYALYAVAAPWGGLTGVPAGFADGVDNDTTYSAGTGLTLTGTTFSADTAYLQRRVGGTCGSGFAIREVNQNGSVVCELDDNTTYGAGAGMDLTGTSFSINPTYRLPQSCAGSEIAKWNGSAWFCGADDDTHYGAGAGLVLTGTTFSADSVYLQRRVGGACGAGFAIRVVNQDGSVTCEPVSGVGNAWLLTGNSGTTPGVNYVGTSDNVALVFKVNAQRALRLEPGANSPNVIGGHIDNWAYGGVFGAAIGGGGRATVANVVSDSYGTVGGGAGNQAGDAASTTDNAQYATVGGGWNNTAAGNESTVGGGFGNNASSGSDTIGGGLSNSTGGGFATVGGGEENTASGYIATVGGGKQNTATDAYATVCGGAQNTASNYKATVGGGSFNIASGLISTVGGGAENSATGWYATVGGGLTNTASLDYATIGGGYGNWASGNSSSVTGGFDNTASGLRATVGGGYDNTAGGSESTVAGGQENSAGGIASTVPGGVLNVAQGNFSFAAGHSAKAYYDGCFVWGDSSDADVTCDNDNRWVARASGGVYFYTNAGLTTGSYLAAGGTSWQVISDRATKENFSPADGEAILATLASLPVQEYNLKSQDASIRHVGLVAQDFAAFGYGESDKAINLEDADGVALVAIQTLYSENKQLKAQVGSLQQENADLDARVTALEQALQGGPPAQAGNVLAAPWLLAGVLAVTGGGVLAGLRRRPGGGG